MTDIRAHIETIRASRLFNAEWYLEQYPDVSMTGMDPAEHYVKFGAQLGRSPHPLFDAAWYSSHHADIARAGAEPLLHFLEHGQYEGRRTRRVGGNHSTVALCVDKRGGLDRKRDSWDVERETTFLDSLQRLRADGVRADHKATVIMPTHNRAEEISAAVESVLAQTHQNWELLIVDDGSVDDTTQVLQRFLDDPRISYHRQPQSGVSKARNAGLSLAQGHYVFYLDSDNTWRPDFLATMVTFMSATGLQAAYCGAYCYTEPGQPTRFQGDDFSWSECLRLNYVDMNGFGHRRELSDRCAPFDESLQRLVDWDFILGLTRETPTAYAPFCGVSYYDGLGGGRISQTRHIDGTLPLLSSLIRAKHPHPTQPSERVTAEQLLGEAFERLALDRLRQSHRPDLVAYDRRIGYVVWDWPALSQSFVITEIKTLIERGADVTVYYKVPAEVAATLDFEVEAHQVDDAATLANLVRQHRRTVLHSPFAYPATTLLTWPCAEATGVPFTFMPGGVDISHHENMKRNRVDEVAASDKCLGVITLGTYHREFLLEQGVPADKVVMGRQAVALPHFAPRRSVSRRPRVVSIARYIEKKGLEFVIRAATAHGGADFHLYGYGPLEQELRDLSARLGATNVTFEAPPTSGAALQAVYAEAEIFILPCVRASNGDLDGLPTVILEAMAAGVLVVSNRISNIPDVIADGVTGFLAEPGDTGSLVTKLAQAIALRGGARGSILQAARRMIESYAGVDRTVALLEGVWSR